MKMFITAVPLIMLVAPSLSQGSDEIGAVCNAALSQGLRDNYFLLTERQQFESYQNRLCDARYSSYDAFKSGATNLGLSVPVAEGLLGLSGSTESRSGQFSEKYSKYCSSTYFDKEYKERFSSYSNRPDSAIMYRPYSAGVETFGMKSNRSSCFRRFRAWARASGRTI